jgi:hypothetical protein
MTFIQGSVDLHPTRSFAAISVRQRGSPMVKNIDPAPCTPRSRLPLKDTTAVPLPCMDTARDVAWSVLYGRQ